jgi:hypothetical protein
MLEKLLIHLKNIIFFKIIIYLLLFVGFSIIAPILQKELDHAQINKEKAYNALKDIKIKLQSINEFGSKLSSIEKKYNNLLNGYESECKNIAEMTKNLEKISKDYKSSEEIEMIFSPAYDYDENITKAKNFKIIYYYLDLKFTALDIKEVVSLSEEIFRILPKTAIILQENIEFSENITPDNLNNLGHLNKPHLINSKIKVMLRNVKYFR